MPSAIRENRLRTIWEAGGAAVNGWLAIPTPFATEVMAAQGWDSLTIDMQHGLVGYEASTAMLAAISTTATVPVVRVPWLDPAHLMKALDAGAYAVICPMINTAADAEKLVAWTSYAPRGSRSFGPVRALVYAGPDYPEHANDTIVRFAMIETAEALDNLDDILKVEGLDAVYIGPSDLSISLGFKPSFDDLARPVSDAVDMILRKSTEAGVIAGIHNGTAASALARIERGFRFVTVGSDARFIAAGAGAVMGEMRAGLARA